VDFPFYHEGLYYAPLFDEFLTIARTFNKPVNIEIKEDNFTREDVKMVIDKIVGAGVTAYTSSFIPQETLYLKEAAAEHYNKTIFVDMLLPTGETPDYTQEVKDWVDRGFDVAPSDAKSPQGAPWGIDLTVELIAYIHNRGKTLHVWTVDTRARLEELEALALVQTLRAAALKGDLDGVFSSFTPLSSLEAAGIAGVDAFSTTASLKKMREAFDRLQLNALAEEAAVLAAALSSQPAVPAAEVKPEVQEPEIPSLTDFDDNPSLRMR